MDIRRTDDTALRVAILRLAARVRPAGGASGGAGGEGGDLPRAVRLPDLVRGVLERQGLSGAGVETLRVGDQVDLLKIKRDVEPVVGAIVPSVGASAPLDGRMLSSFIDLRRAYAPVARPALGANLHVWG